MKHHFPPDAWRCVQCGLPAARAEKEPTCHPDDGASFVASLADDDGDDARPCDTEPSTEGV